MIRNMRIGPIILLVLSVAGEMLGLGLCGRPIQNEDFGNALVGALLLVVSGVGVITALIWCLRSRSGG